MQKIRPKYLSLRQIRLPIPGIVSILHRISGILLFIAIPFLLYLLQGSLSSESTFVAYCNVVRLPIIKLLLLVILWGFFHHMCAGIRFLFLDIHKGVALSTARATAKMVIVISLLLTLIVGALLW